MAKKIDPYNTDPSNPYFGSGMTATAGLNRNDKNMLNINLSEKHRTEFIERFKWKNLPPELNQDLIERILYFRFKGALFKFNEKFYFLPFALHGTIDSYGRYETINPVLFTGQFKTTEQKWEESSFLPAAVMGEGFPVAYGKMEKLTDKFSPAIILTDKSLGISQDVLPEFIKAQSVLERMTNTLAMIEMNNINGVQTFTIVVDDEEQKKAAELEFASYDEKILSGKRMVVIVSNDKTNKPFQELNSSRNIQDSSRYWQSFTSWDNLRKELIGVPNGGQFLKMEHTTESESEMSTSNGSGTRQNALRMRKEFCELVNYYYNLNIDVEDSCTQEESITEPKGQQTLQLEGDVE